MLRTLMLCRRIPLPVNLIPNQTNVISWMSRNKLKLNTDKTEIMPVGAKCRLSDTDGQPMDKPFHERAKYQGPLRLLCKTHDLHLLDLWTLLEVSIPHLQDLYLDRTPLPRERDDALFLLLGKLCHSLKILDLSWTSPDADSLENGIDAMSGSGYCPLTHCNFAGSTINLPTAELLLMDFTLQSLDLTSCRSLPRGIKCLHEGPAALQRLRASIRELMATHSKRVVEDGGSDSYPHF